MIHSQIRVFDTFPDITEEIDRLTVRALDAGVEQAAETAKQIGAERNLTEFETVPAHGALDGFTAGLRAGRFYYRFQSYGTLGRAIRPKRPGTKRSHAPGTGITPNRMFQRARSAGRKKIVETLARGLR